MRSISVSPELVIVIDRLVDAFRMLSRMMSLACADLVAQRLMRAGDRGADALRMGDDGFALAAQPVDQRADARGVLRIGALDLVDFGVDERFEFDRARERALDAFAHRRQLRGARPGRPS